ncbi:MAG: lytic transglycosylase domain-containing protein [Oscillospiraceae bacterium]|jgi:soluble lytic murein transglycosylase-like protein|nr:lytic transglycosylase domain-containing protein [Oscillospiraceae bacterium]
MSALYLTGIAQARLAEVNQRLAGRMGEIGDRTGVDFSGLFVQAAAQTVAEVQTETAADSADLRLSTIGALATDTGGAGQTDIAALIDSVSAAYGVSPTLISAVIQAESNFDANAVSSAGAMGLMQLMPATAKGLGVTDPFNPQQNVDGGVRFLLSQIISFDGDVQMALAAYNCGPTGVTARGIEDLNDPLQRALLPQETQQYLKNIENILAAIGQETLLTTNFYETI